MNHGLMPIREKLKRRKRLAIFFVFLVFSSLLWLLIKLSNVYTINIDIGLTFVEAPYNIWISEKDIHQTIKANVSDQGFRLLKLRYLSGKTHPVTISLEKVPLRKLNQNTHYIILLNIKDIIKSGLKVDDAEVSFAENEIYLSSYAVSTKKIPVKAQLQVDFAPPFGQYGPIVLQPDSILVHGPDHVLDTISTLPTKPIKAKNLTTDLTGSIPLETANSLIKTEIKTVDFKLFTEKFTENNLKLKIFQPSSVALKLFPEHATLFFTIALKDFEKTITEDFVIMADTAGLNDKRPSLRLHLVSKPDYINIWRIEPESVEYIILK